MKFTLSKMGPFTSFLNGAIPLYSLKNGLINGTFKAYLPSGTMKPSRHLGALKRRVTCNCGPRGTVSCGFQVSKEQLEEERLRQEGQEEIKCHEIPKKDGWNSNMCELISVKHLCFFGIVGCIWFRMV